MDPKDTIPIARLRKASAPPANGVGRRAVLQTIAGGFGAAIALPVAEAHPVHRHLADRATVAQADAKAAAAAYTPEFLDAHQLETLSAIAERIVPRSTEARVAEFIDQLLAVDAPASQQAFLGSLGAFEGHARERFGRPWKTLTAEQQNALLMDASTAPAGRRMPDSFDPRGRVAPVGAKTTIRDHFENLKGWVSGAYYSSEIGMRELGWTEQMFFETFPGCDHPGGHSGE
jgi:hypothetical protein